VAAYHWLQALELTRAAGADEPELAARARAALVEAGERAQRLAANDAARELYAQALALLPDGNPERPQVLYRYGRAAAYAGIDADGELAEAAAALLAAGDVEAAAEATFARSFYFWNLDSATAARYAEEALRLVANRPPSPVKAYVVGMIAIRRALAGDTAAAVAYAEQELELGLQLGLERHRAHALITIGTARANAGDPAAAEAIEEGLALARELNDVVVVIRGYKNLASTVASLGELARSTKLTEEALAAAIQYGDRFHVNWFEVELAWFDLLAGDWDSSLRRLDAFRARLQGGRHYMEHPAAVVRSRILGERGRVDEGLGASVAALEAARAIGEPQVLVPALANHARLLLLAGHPDRASATADEALSSVVPAVEFTVPDVVTVLADLGRVRDLERLAASPGSTGWGRAVSAFARGDLAAAAALYERMGAHVHEADARLRLARALAAAGATADAAREADAAAALYRRMGAGPRVAEAETAAAIPA
jgi:tetratricopeptide (TPR) repeat protein